MKKLTELEFGNGFENFLSTIGRVKSDNPWYVAPWGEVFDEFRDSKSPEVDNMWIQRLIVSGDVTIGELAGQEIPYLISEQDIFEEKKQEQLENDIKTKKEKRINKKKVKFLKSEEEKTLILSNHLEDEDFSKKYYRTLGFLARNTKIIARIPSDTKEWFDERYCMVKGNYPEKSQPGYILHTEDTNKWYAQVQILFYLPTGKSTDMVLEPGMVLVKGSSYDELKPYSIDYPAYTKNTKFIVNGNELCWSLLELGFDLGDVHNIEEIRSHVPAEYVKCFDEGI